MKQVNVRNILKIVREDKENKVFRLMDFKYNKKYIQDFWHSENFDIIYDEIYEGFKGVLRFINFKRKKKVLVNEIKRKTWNSNCNFMWNYVGLSGVLGQLLFQNTNVTVSYLVSIHMFFSGVFILSYVIIREGKEAFKVWQSNNIVTFFIFTIFGLKCSDSYSIKTWHTLIMKYCIGAFVMQKFGSSEVRGCRKKYNNLFEYMKSC